MNRAQRVLLASNSLGGGTSAPAASWQTVFELSLGTDDTGYSGNNLRNITPAASLLDGIGTAIRVTLHAGTGGAIISNAYVGHPAGAGDTYDFDGNQQRLTFDAGSNGVTISAGAQKLSDEVAFAYDGSKPLIVAMHFSGTTGIRYAALSGGAGWLKAAADETGTANVTGYANGGADFSNVVTKIEALI